MKLNKEENKAIALLKQLDNFDDLCETCYYVDTERKTKYGCCGCREEAKDIVLNQYYKKEIYPSLYQWSDITITEHYDEMIELLQELLGDK